MARHTRRKRGRDQCCASRCVARSDARDETSRRYTGRYPGLRELAAAFGRQLHDVPADDSCQFHALLDALQHQLQPPRAAKYDVRSLRRAVLHTLDSDALLDRSWVGPGDDPAAPVETLRERRDPSTLRGSVGLVASHLV